MSKDRIRAVVVCLVVLSTLSVCADAQISRPSSANCRATDAQSTRWGDIPLSFEPNMGQEPHEVRYLARGSSYTLYLAGGEMFLGGHNQQAPLRMKLLGANIAAPIMGEGASRTPRAITLLATTRASGTPLFRTMEKPGTVVSIPA